LDFGRSISDVGRDTGGTLPSTLDRHSAWRRALIDMNYLVVRIDAQHVLPAGYVNPAITRSTAR
jgi:hypothetical protein